MVPKRPNRPSNARVIPTYSLNVNVDPRFVQRLGSMVVGGWMAYLCVEEDFSAFFTSRDYDDIAKGGYRLDVLIVTLVVCIMTCAGTSILLCYVQLRTHDYRWWWSSFWNCASAGVYLLFVQREKHRHDIVSDMIYGSNLLVESVRFGLVCGCVGFLSSLLFVRSLYGTIQTNHS